MYTVNNKSKKMTKEQEDNLKEILNTVYHKQLGNNISDKSNYLHNTTVIIKDK